MISSQLLYSLCNPWIYRMPTFFMVTQLGPEGVEEGMALYMKLSIGASSTSAGGSWNVSGRGNWICALDIGLKNSIG